MLAKRGQPPYHRVIPSEPIKASRGISTEARKPRARCEHTKLFLAKMLLPAIELQRFYLDPATASPCGLLARQSARLAKLRCPRSASAPTHRLRWSRLRATPCAQDDTDGMKSRISGERSSPLRGCVRIWNVSRMREEQAPPLPVGAMIYNKSRILLFHR